MYGIKNIRPTLDRILIQLRERIDFQGGKTILMSLLRGLGFS